MNAGTIFHGNYQAAKNEKKVAAYCMKDGDYLENYMFHTWVNFHKDMQDFTEWQMHMDEQKMKEIEWPIYLPKIPLLQQCPTVTEKKCNWLIIGPPDSGKTRWLETQFQMQRIYKSLDPRYPFEGYNGEAVIVWDDCYPKRKDLIAASNVYLTRTLVGATRYRRTYWPMNQRRVLILLNNEEPTYFNEPWFQARFNLINL
jgi:hypothetical protein